MPLIWRYLWRYFIQVFTLCVSSFIAMLLVLRFQDIARFAASGTGVKEIALFTFLQIPYVLPLAIPLSALIAAILLFQRLSDTHELTALRASGIGLRAIITPLLIGGFFLTLLNTAIISEIAPRCRILAREAVIRSIAVNPLLLFQKNSPIKLKNAYVDIGSLTSGQSAREAIVAIQNQSTSQLTLMLAESLALEGNLLKGKGVSLISNAKHPGGEGFDHLIIENQDTMDTQASYLSQYTQNTDWDLSYEHSCLRQILTREKVKREGTTSLRLGDKAQLEIAKRVSLGLAAWTFTWVGIACGLNIGRQRSRLGTVAALLLAAFYLICFIGARSFRHTPSLAIWIYLLPHPVLWAAGIPFYRRIERGGR